MHTNIHFGVEGSDDTSAKIKCGEEEMPLTKMRSDQRSHRPPDFPFEATIKWCEICIIWVQRRKRMRLGFRDEGDCGVCSVEAAENMTNCRGTTPAPTVPRNDFHCGGWGRGAATTRLTIFWEDRMVP